MIPLAALELERALATTEGVKRFVDGIDLSVHTNTRNLETEWAEIEKNSAMSVYQRREWIETYISEFSNRTGFQPYIVAGRFNGEIVFILPLEIKRGIVKRIKFIGGSHVNFNIAMVHSRYLNLLNRCFFEHLYKRLQGVLPGIGYIALCCQPETWLGKDNPALGRSSQRTGNPAYVLNLEGGFEATLARGNGKRKRKKFRQQCRMVEEMGGYEFVMPATPREVDETVDVFFEQKSRRLREMGIRDVFAERETKAFVKNLARKSLGMDEPMLQLFALRVGGDVVAVFGGGFHNNRFSGYFSSIAGEEWQALSPGEMLLYLIVEELCERGCVQLDLGAGDERYKRSWSSDRIEVYETLMPCNMLAVPVIWLRKLYGRLRCHVRENEQAWEIYKSLRRYRSLVNS